MSMHARNFDSELTENVCKYCRCRDHYYEGADWDNETADWEIEYCEHMEDCPVQRVDWESFIIDIVKKEIENDSKDNKG